MKSTEHSGVASPQHRGEKGWEDGCHHRDDRQVMDVAYEPSRKRRVWSFSWAALECRRLQHWLAWPGTALLI